MTTSPARASQLPTLALFALGLIAWGGGLQHGLQGDDGVLLNMFMDVRDAPPGLASYFLEPSWGIFYRPLGAYLYDRLFAVFWPAVWPLHLLALGTHCLAAVAVVRLARICEASAAPAWLAGAIFVTLPALAEPVLWTAALHGMLENALSLWAIVFLVEARRGAWRPWRAAAGVGCFLLAIATKESGLVVLGVLGLHDLLWRRDLDRQARRWGALAAVYLPMLAGAAGVLLMRGRAYGGFRLFSVNTFDLGYLSVAVERAIVACFSPVPWRAVEVVLNPVTYTAVAVPVLLFLPVALAGTFAARGARAPLWLWMSLWGVLLPVASVAVVPAERHVYLPSAFAATLLALAAARLLGPGPRRARLVTMAAAFWLAVQLAAAHQRVRAWRDADTHVRAVLEQTERLLPGLPANALLLYLGVPDEVDGALVFRFENINAFLHARYGLDGLRGMLLSTPADLPATLLEAPGMLRFTIAARGSHVYWPDSMHGGAFAKHDDLLVRRGRLGKSWLLADWIRAGKPAYVLLYDAHLKQLRLGDAALRADVADKLLWIDYEGKTPLELYE